MQSKEHARITQMHASRPAGTPGRSELERRKAASAPPPKGKTKGEDKGGRPRQRQKGEKKKTMVKILTWNIAGRHDGFDLEKVAAVLRAQACDVVCLQEVGGDGCNGGSFPTQAHALAAALRMGCNPAPAHGL